MVVELLSCWFKERARYRKPRQASIAGVDKARNHVRGVHHLDEAIAYENDARCGKLPRFHEDPESSHDV
jgi:hypothetical protein